MRISLFIIGAILLLGFYLIDVGSHVMIFSSGLPEAIQRQHATANLVGVGMQIIGTLLIITSLFKR